MLAGDGSAPRAVFRAGERLDRARHPDRALSSEQGGKTEIADQMVEQQHPETANRDQP